MGADSSKLLRTIDVERMPSYFVKNPVIDSTKVGILKQSLGKIVGDQNLYKNQRLPFCDFYDRFYDRLNELKDAQFNPCTYIEDSNTVQVKSIYLVRLLKLICILPQNMLANDINNPLLLDDESRNELTRFHIRYSTINLKCYGPVGEALFQAVQQTDEMFSRPVETAWKSAYSLLLRHYIPVALSPKKAKRNSLRYKTFYDLSLDCYSSSSDSTSETPDEDADSRPRTTKSPLERLIAKKRLKKKSASDKRRPSRPSNYVKTQLRAISRLIEMKMVFHHKPKPFRYHTVTGVRNRRNSETNESCQTPKSLTEVRKRRDPRVRNRRPSVLRVHSQILSSSVCELDQGVGDDMSKRIDIHKNSPQFFRKRNLFYRSGSYSESPLGSTQRRFSAPSILHVDQHSDLPEIFVEE